MSKVIKAAELKVLIPNESQTVIPTLEPKRKTAQTSNTGGTMLDSANLLEDAQEKAAEILENAQEKADWLIEQSTQKVETLRLQAKEEGFEKGYQEGLIEGRQAALMQASDLITLLDTTVEEAVQVRANSLAALEEDFLKFSLLLADKIVKKNVSFDISWLAPLISDSLASLGQVQEILVRLNPTDYALVKEQEEHFSVGVRTKLEFESDATITQGGCLIESENGLIDARLEKRLGKTFKHLMDVLYDET